jgi:hypothetical protein
MSSPAPAALQVKSANAFLFTSHSGKTKITYYPDAPGPLIRGLTPGALFEYAGPEGNFSFRSTQITRQDTPAGQLLSVVLKPQFDAGSLTYSVFLPKVNLGAGIDEQSFTTYGVKAHHAGTFVGAGAQITYETERLSGDAKALLMAR